MAVADIFFDIILFGLLMGAVWTDRAFPMLAGAALLAVTTAWTYLSSLDLCDWLRQRGIRAHESLVTSLAPVLLGLAYYTESYQARLFSPHGENLALLALSIGLMMATLMAMISLIACISEHKVQTAIGVFSSFLAAGALSLLGAYLIMLGLPPQKPSGVLALALGGFVCYRLLLISGFKFPVSGNSAYETQPPPSATQVENPSPAEASAREEPPEGCTVVPTPLSPPAPENRSPAVAAPADNPSKAAPERYIIPLRGWALKRFALVLLLAPVFFYLMRGLRL